MFKLLRSAMPLALALCMTGTLAHAQSGLDVFFGAGTASAPSSNQSIDTFGTGSPFTTPRLAGAFGKAGADFMVTPHFGINAETDFRFSQGAYAGLTYRPLFYDFNGVWMPTAHLKRVTPVFEAGLGAVNLSYFNSQSFCDAFAGCSSSSQQVDSSHHFQVHMAAGLRLYAARHLFIQPQVEAHWVNNFFQFGSNWVPEYGASVGWSFGER